MTIPVNITIKFNLLWHWIQNYWLHICSDDQFLSLPFHMNIFPPPISKNIFFKKCACISRYFYIKQKGMTLFSLMYLITDYVRLEWLNVQLNWVGWFEPRKKVNCAHSFFFLAGGGVVICCPSPQTPSPSSKFIVPQNTDDSSFTPHSLTKCVVSTPFFLKFVASSKNWGTPLRIFFHLPLDN